MRSFFTKVFTFFAWLIILVVVLVTLISVFKPPPFSVGPFQIDVRVGSCLIVITINGSSNCGNTENAPNGDSTPSKTRPASATPAGQSAVIATPTAPVITITETLYVPFKSFFCPTNGQSSLTKSTYSYKGQTRIEVSGTGQAKGTQQSDAFYVFTDSKGNQLPHPAHMDNGKIDAVLWIDEQAVDTFTTIPAYNATHSYSFVINAPGGRLSFAINDCHPSNNTGGYTITITAL